MASDGTHGHGSALAGASAGTIGNIISVSIDGQTRDAIDKSTMDSTSKFREFISGMADAGEVTVEVNYDGSAAGVANSLNTIYQGGTAETWTITMVDTSSFSSAGFITNLSIAVPFDDKITQSITIKLSGVPTFTDVA